VKLLLVILCAGSVFAQSTATISGRVLDPSGAAIRGANVEAVNEATRFTRR
jgi:hypothetical protein